MLRLAASVVIEQNEECLVDRRYLPLDSLAPLLEQRREGEDNEKEELGNGVVETNFR